MRARRKRPGHSHVAQLLGRQGLDGGVHSRFLGKVGDYADKAERRREQKHLVAYLRGDDWYVHCGDYQQVRRQSF